MFSRAIALVIAMGLVCALPAAAADDKTPTSSPNTSTERAVNVRLLALAREPKRPLALSVLYGSYATLQVLDIVSTRQVIAAGGYEANPLMRSGQLPRMIAVKAASAGLSIYLAERMWKKNRAGAIATMALANGLTAAIVAHNASLRR